MERATTAKQTEELTERIAENMGLLANTDLILNQGITNLTTMVGNIQGIAAIYTSETEPSTTNFIWIKPQGEA